MTAQMPALLDQKSAAEFLGVSPKWLERDRWKGPRLSYVKVGRAVRYRAADLVDFIDANAHPATAE
jgi:hypothetical protein